MISGWNHNGGCACSPRPIQRPILRIRKALVLGGLLLLGLAGTAAYGVSFDIPESLPALNPPLLTTTCGQSPGSLMVKVVCRQISLECEQADTITAEELADKCLESPHYGAIFITTGTSLKGMGAAGVDLNSEIKRCSALVSKAKELGIPVIVGQIEGSSRRVDEYDEQSIKSMTPLADLLITRSDVNQDNYFTQIAGEKGIPQIFIEETLELKDLLPLLFNAE